MGGDDVAHASRPDRPRAGVWDGTGTAGTAPAAEAPESTESSEIFFQLFPNRGEENHMLAAQA